MHTVLSTTGSPCQLNCKPKNGFFSVMLKDMVKDGTPCRAGMRDMCINGRCKVGGFSGKCPPSFSEATQIYAIFLSQLFLSGMIFC